MLPPAQVDSLYEIVLSVEQLEPASSLLTNGVLQHINSALFLLHKLFSQDELSFSQVQLGNAKSHQSRLLKCINKLLEACHLRNPEVTINCLRVLLAFLQKLDQVDQQLPMLEIKQTRMLETGLKKCLFLSNAQIITGETVHLTLKVLTQISFAYPLEIKEDIVKRVLDFCGHQDDQRAQENAIKLICNLLTDEQSCSVVLQINAEEESAAINGIYQCLLSESRNSLKYSLGAILNLTLLSEHRLRSCEMILSSGGMSHLVGAIQKSFNLNDSESAQFGMKALLNLLGYRNPMVKLLAAELGYLDIFMMIIRQMYQTVMKSAAQEVGRTDRAQTTKRRNESLRSAILAGMDLLDAVSGTSSPSQNKLKLLESTGFLPFCNRMVLLSVEKPT